MSILVCEGISVAFGVKEILRDVSFSLNEGSRLGIIGANGTGKSTLLRVIQGIQSTESGRVVITRGSTMGCLEQLHEGRFGNKNVYDAALDAFSELLTDEIRLEKLQQRMEAGDTTAIEPFTALQEKFKSDGGYEYRGRTRSYLAALGFTEAQMALPAEKLSGGQKTKLMLAGLLLREPDIILLDEPTNHLDASSILWLEKIIAASKKTFLIVSHDRLFLDRVCSHTLELEHCGGMFFEGAYTAFREKKQKLLEDQRKHYELQQREIARIESFIENQRRWNRERNIIAAESRMKMLDRMEKIERPKESRKAPDFRMGKTTSKSARVLSVRHLSKKYPARELFRDLSFELRQGDRFFVIGDNGSGKSTLIKILTGRERADHGVFETGFSQKVGYYDQDSQLLTAENTVLDELCTTYEDKKPGELRAALAKFGFYGEDVFKPVSVLSGGERARLSIAKMILEGVSFLMLDEPTNHLDIPSKEALETALATYDGTLLCVSHDRYFISKLATRVLDFTPQGENEPVLFEGTYDCYQSLTETATPDRKPQIIVKNDYTENKREKSRIRRQEGLRKRLEESIADLERQLASLTEEATANPADYILLAELHEREEAVNAELETLYEQLFELEDEE